MSNEDTQGPDSGEKPKIIIDEDWKTQVEREREQAEGDTAQHAEQESQHPELPAASLQLPAMPAGAAELAVAANAAAAVNAAAEMSASGALEAMLSAGLQANGHFAAGPQQDGLGIALRWVGQHIGSLLYTANVAVLGTV